jgi:hypothetical protein
MDHLDLQMADISAAHLADMSLMADILLIISRSSAILLLF